MGIGPGSVIFCPRDSARDRSCSPSEQPDREMKIPPVLPRPSNQVDAVVERDRADQDRNANADPQRVAQHEGIEVLKQLPHVAAVEKNPRLPNPGERYAQLDPRIDE